MKPTLICIIGESGSGKSMIAQAIQEQMGIPTLLSYTDRPRRDESDNGHTFLSVAEFDELKYSDMIAFTQFGSNRYCCLKKDVGPVNTYVIDEFGYNHLLKHHTDDYHITSLRIYRPYSERIKSVGKERVDRDKGKFTRDYNFFDHCILNAVDDKEGVIEESLLIVQRILRNKKYMHDEYPSRHGCAIMFWLVIIALIILYLWK